MPQNRHLPRLTDSFYTGKCTVFWTLCIQNRRTGWLNDATHQQFRELFLHTAYRHQIATLVYCLMPDHIHFIWQGIDITSNQKNAIQFFRKTSNQTLSTFSVEWQRQSYDHVLREQERTKGALSSTIHYILENPLRKELYSKQEDYPYSGSILPGFPRVDVHDGENYWKVYNLVMK